MRWCFLFICLFLCSSLVSQRDGLKKVNEYFKSKNYRNALLELSRMPQAQSSAPLIFKKAICLYELNKIDNALVELNRAENMGYDEKEMLYYLGRIMHHKGQFLNAIKAYKKYLKESALDDPKRNEVRDHIRHSGAGLDILYLDPLATIENAGAEINSTQNEERLIQSSGKVNRYYYNSDKIDKNKKVDKYLNQSYDLDVATDINVFFTEKKGSNWSRGEKLSDRNVNSYKNDKLVGLSMDGQSIYILRGKEKDKKENQELIAQNASPQVKDRFKALVEILGFVEYYHFFNDSTVVFSSNKLEGRGGHDLFVTAYANGGWLSPKNLGKQINTHHDEISPYLSNDGSVLYFSSNRSFSVGGLDIFKSNYLFEQEKWTDAKNVGLPINSPGNEVHFRLSDDGLLAFYTSDRKDGYGKNDIYFAYLNEKEDHQSYTVKNLGFVNYPDFYIDKIDLPGITQNIPPEEDTKTPNNKKPDEKPIVKNRKPVGDHNQYNILLPTLTLDPSGELLNQQNFEKLDVLAAELNKAEVENIEIMSFSHQAGIAEYNLFLSIKNAEKIKAALMERGLDGTKVHIKGYGDYLPLIKPYAPQNISFFNNRIQFKINLKKDNIKTTAIELDIDKKHLNRGFEIFKTIIDDAISYKIQIATVRQMYRGTALRLYNDVQVEKDKSTGNYLYSVGLYDSFLEANTVMRELSEYGVTSLKIVPFVDGLRIPEKDLVNYAQDYPTLKDYIRSMTFTEIEEE